MSNMTPALSGFMVEKKHTYLEVNAGPSQVASHQLLDLSLINYYEAPVFSPGNENLICSSIFVLF